MADISVIIPTYSPDPEILRKAMLALKAQTLSPERFELVIVDNASPSPLLPDSLINLDCQVRIVREDQPGLTHARVRGVQEAGAPIAVFVDDDNFLDPRYLESSLDLMEKNPRVGVAGGRNIAEWEETPADWIVAMHPPLGLSDAGSLLQKASWSNPTAREFPEFAPIGAGMVFRKDAFAEYLKSLRSRTGSVITDRKGDDLASSGDNDIVMSILAAGWEIAYDPSLQLRHYITSGRITVEYLKKITYCSARDWTRVCRMHGVGQCKTVPKWSLPLRRLKAFLREKPWTSHVAGIRYAMAKGVLEGQSE